MNFNLDFIEMILLALALIYSIVSHELGHGYMAYLFGDNTAKNMGRLSLNPIDHIDPLGLVSMFIFKFGWAKPVPISSGNFKNYRMGLFFVSIAGIMVNILSAFFSLLIIIVFPNFMMNNPYVLFFLSMVVTYGISLATFNLLPIPPLDGSKIILSFLPKKLHNIIFKIERFGFLILMGLIFFNFLDGPIDYIYNFIYQGILGLIAIIV